MIKEDKSYLSKLDLLTIEKGIAQLDIHSLRFDRVDFTEEEKEENRRIANIVSQEEWERLCDENKRRTAMKIEPIIESLSNKFDIHQYKDSSMGHYQSDWDLFFWCNNDNKGRDMSYVTLSLNENRIVERRILDVEQVLNYIKEIGFDGVNITIQYTATYNDDKVREIALEYAEKVKNTVVQLMGYSGKIKKVSNDQYGFFKKGAKKRYYQLSNKLLLEMAISKLSY